MDTPAPLCLSLRERRSASLRERRSASARSRTPRIAKLRSRLARCAVRGPLLLGVTLWVAACAGSYADLLVPSLRLVDVRPVSGGVLEQRMRVTLVAQNPNDFDLILDGIRLDLAVNDRPLGRAVSSREYRLARLEETRIEVEASVTLIEVLQQLTQLGSRQGLGYQLTGDLFVRSPVSTTLGFEQSGDFVRP